MTVKNDGLAPGSKSKMREDKVTPLEPKYLFIMGCDRSGTTAVTDLLNVDPRIIIGRERFKHKIGSVNRSNLDQDSFFSPGVDDTNHINPEFYARLRTKWEGGAEEYRGDKVPRYYKVMAHLATEFPGCKMIFMIRELSSVASSFEARAINPKDVDWPPERDYFAGAQVWNESLAYLLSFVGRFGDANVFPIIYEKFFSGNLEYLARLYEFLGLSGSDEVRRQFQAMTGLWKVRRIGGHQLGAEAIEFLSHHKNDVLERNARAVAAAKFREPNVSPGVPCPICAKQGSAVSSKKTEAPLLDPNRCRGCGARAGDRSSFELWSRIGPDARGQRKILRVDPTRGANFEPWLPGDDLESGSDADSIIRSIKSIEPETYDAIVCADLQVPDGAAERIHGLLHALLRPGGFVQLETSVNRPERSSASSHSLERRLFQVGRRYAWTRDSSASWSLDPREIARKVFRFARVLRSSVRAPSPHVELDPRFVEWKSHVFDPVSQVSRPFRSTLLKLPYAGPGKEESNVLASWGRDPVSGSWDLRFFVFKAPSEVVRNEIESAIWQDLDTIEDNETAETGPGGGRGAIQSSQAPQPRELDSAESVDYVFDLPSSRIKALRLVFSSKAELVFVALSSIELEVDGKVSALDLKDHRSWRVHRLEVIEVVERGPILRPTGKDGVGWIALWGQGFRDLEVGPASRARIRVRLATEGVKELILQVQGTDGVQRLSQRIH